MKHRSQATASRFATLFLCAAFALLQGCAQLGAASSSSPVIDRILSRGEGRTDDTEEAVERRLGVYRAETTPVLEHYRQSVVRIDGVGSMEEIAARIEGALGRP